MQLQLTIFAPSRGMRRLFIALILLVVDGTIQSIAFQNGAESTPIAPQRFAFHNAAGFPETAPVKDIKGSPLAKSASPLHTLNPHLSDPIMRASSLPIPKDKSETPSLIQRTASLPLFAFSSHLPLPAHLACRRRASCTPPRLANPRRLPPLRMADDDVPAPSDDLWASLRRRLPSDASGAVAASTDPAVRPEITPRSPRVLTRARCCLRAASNTIRCCVHST